MCNTTNNYNGVGFSGLLAICFIVLKLTGFISWSWWWVLSPIWIGALFVIVIVAAVLLVALAAYLNK